MSALEYIALPLCCTASLKYLCGILHLVSTNVNRYFIGYLRKCYSLKRHTAYGSTCVYANTNVGVLD